MANLFDHLVANEVGTSAFLATLLDPSSDHAVFVGARAAIATVLKKHGLELSSPAPTHVKLEYLNIDLVAVWSGWTILVENKVASASVTRGQLRDYYAVSLIQLERNGFLKLAGAAISKQPICFVYLTPTPLTGTVEFESLVLAPGRSDRKIHLNWSELLDHLAPLSGKSNDHASWFFDSGIDRIQRVLKETKPRLPEDERRYSLQALMNELKVRLQNSEPFVDLVFSRWSDQSREQLFATGPARSAYVGLYVSFHGSSFPSPHTIRAVGDISFDVASKHRIRLRNVLAGKTRDEWSTTLGVPSEAVQLNLEKGSLSWRFALPEVSRDEFLRETTRRLADFSSVFRSTLAEAVGRSAAYPGAAADRPQT